MYPMTTHISSRDDSVQSFGVTPSMVSRGMPGSGIIQHFHGRTIFVFLLGGTLDNLFLKSLSVLLYKSCQCW
jgi:hypothetical protein